MIPRSTTLTEAGRRMRSRVLWGVGSVVALIAATIAFVALDRSTVVDGPTGSSYVTTATGLAALHDTFERDGRRPDRLLQPLSGGSLRDVDAYLVSDVEFGGFGDSELATLENFAERGGTVVVLGVPPRPVLQAFDIEIEWVGSSAGVVPVLVPMADADTVDGSRFGTFAPGFEAAMLAGTSARPLAVSFPRGAGFVVLIADSSLGHNATLDRSDNVDFLGDLLPGRTAFDEYRHGFDDTPTVGLLSSAPGNWTGAAIVGAATLLVALVVYGRRFGTVEPNDRMLVPDRSVFIDSVARSLRRAGGELPTQPLRLAVCHHLGLPASAAPADILAAARREGLDDELLARLGASHPEEAFALDHTLATLSTRRGTMK